MQTRKLGQTGPEISAIGIGAMSFAGVYGETTEAGAHALLDRARELGITHIDTSNIYGKGLSETYIGSYLAKPANRDAFHIATKAGITGDPTTKERRFDNKAAHLETELEGSLKRLGIDHVDLFYVHRRDPSIPIEEVTGTLVRLIETGKIRAFGYSEIAPASLRRAHDVHPVAAVQSEYSLQTRLPDLGLRQACAELGTTLVAFSPVGRGLLTDTPPDLDKIAGIPFLTRNPRFTTENLPRNLAITERFRDLARNHGLATATLAIAWLLDQGDHIVPIPGTRNITHLDELAAGASFELTAALRDEIERLLPPGWAHGDRYSHEQSLGPEGYC